MDQGPAPVGPIAALARPQEDIYIPQCVLKRYVRLLGEEELWQYQKRKRAGLRLSIFPAGDLGQVTSF